jgi:hypothetical protein
MEERYKPHPTETRPTLAHVPYAAGRNELSPRWAISTNYNDWRVVLEVKYDAVEQQERHLVYVDGEHFEVVTHNEFLERQDIARQHGDTLSKDGFHVVSQHDPLLRVFTELTARFNALKYLVDLNYTI